MSAAEKNRAIIVANRGAPAAAITLHYTRVHFPSRTKQEVEVEIVIDAGPDLIRRALDALCVKLNNWNRADDRFKYFTT
jgi:hypothetical protein